MEVLNTVKTRKRTLPDGKNIEEIEGLPKWAVQDYEGDERDFADWFKSHFLETFLRRFTEKQLKDPELLARIDAIANDFALSRTQKTRSKVERSFVYQVYMADKTGWYRLLPAEYDTLEELLSGVYDSAIEGTTEAYNIGYFIKTGVPLLKEAGATPNDLWGIPFLPGKAAAVVPGLREILRCSECGEKNAPGSTKCLHGHKMVVTPEQKEAAVALTRLVADKDISTNDIRATVAAMRGVVTKAPTPLRSGDVFQMPNGEEWILLKSPGQAQTRAIELALKGLVTDGLFFRDAWALIRELSKTLTGIDISPNRNDWDLLMTQSCLQRLETE